ncbi:MAG: GEVED domain-containing protein [Saprospiraceae bacterium]
MVEIDVEERSADFLGAPFQMQMIIPCKSENSGSSTWFEFNPTDPNFSLVYFTPCTSYEWRIRANCGGTSSDYSSIENFSTTGCTDYCDAYGSDSDLSNGVDEWIESVNLVNVSHTSGNNWGYQDNFNLVAQAVQGDQLTAQLQPGFGPVGSHAVYWAIWIDFNQDDDFLDAGEQVYVSGSPSSSTVNASFMIPATAPTGVTRMRIAMKKGGPAAACGDFDFGEVEDYGIQINSGGSGGDYCTSGGSNTATDYIARIKMANLNSISGNENGGYSDFTNLIVNAVKGSSYNIIFTPNLPYGNNRWRYWRVWIDYNQDGDFEDANELAFESVNAFQLPLTGSIQIPLSVQSGQTRMRVSMKYVAPSNLIIQGPCDVFSHGEVEDYTIVLSDDASGYCQARGEFSDEIWIERVRLADINNFTVSNNGYAYFPNATTDLEAGTSYPVELTPGFVGTNIEVFWRVYIDFNQDEDFDDPGELVEQSPAPPVAHFNGSVAIPQNVPAGSTRMRVMMKFVNSNEIFYPTQCSDFLFGEVEDYLVTIVGGMDPPVANFSGTPTSGTAPLSVNFTDLSTGSPTSWNWNFGDGQTSTLQNPSVTYSAPGVYTVSLTVSNAGGNDTETKVDYIEVENVSDCDPPQDVQITQVGYSYCRADWTAVPGALQYQTRIRVVGAPSWTTGSMFTNNWRYWIGRTPNTTYELQVRLECATGWSIWSTSAVFTTLGAGDPYCYSYGSSTANYIDRVVFAGIDNESGQNFGYGHYTNLVGNVGTGFSYPITLTPEGSAADLYWRVWIDFNQDNDFEDAGEQVYQGQGDNATPLTGQIAIPLSAMTGTTRMRVAMGDTGYPEPCTIGGVLEVEDYALVISSGLQAPQADFVATQVCGQAPAQIQFTDASSNMPTSWSWNFGNGQTSTTANPTASFANPGVYTVSLTVSNAAGSSTETKVSYITISYITIVAPPQVSASPATTVCHGSPITLTASGSTTYDWIGTGLSSTTGSQVLVSPPNPGTYSYVVTGIVNGCSSAPSTIELNFTPAPTVSVSSSGNACLGDTVYLSATGALSYSWTGPGLLGTSGSSVAALPTANGLYSYEVIGTSNGCSSIPQTVTVSVSQSPVVQIMASSTEICSGDAISLTASGATTYSWTGSGLSSNVGSAVSALPTGTGVFTYSVIGSIGTCISPATQIEIEVLASPSVDISASSIDACVGESIELTASGADTYAWTGSGLSGSTGAAVLANPVGPGSYTYSVVGTSGVCSSPPQSITLQFNSIPTINAGVSPSSICLGQACTFSGTGAANLIWSGPGLNPTQGNPLSFTPVNTGVLTFTVVGQNSTCSSNPVEVVLEVLETPELEIEPSGNPICLGDTELTGMWGPTCILEWT